MRKIVASALFAAIAAVACAQDTPTMGWSSWNAFGPNISQTLIQDQATAMVATGLDAIGYRYVNIDAGFFGGRHADGTLIIHPVRFPHGLGPVVEHIHRLGLKAGIYSDAGHSACTNFYRGDTLTKDVGMYGHDQEDCDLFFRRLGFDFLKVDFCGGDPPQNHAHLHLDEQERYTAIRDAILRTGRTDVVLNVCRWNYPGTWVSAVGNSWRISHDITASWPSVSDIIRQNLYLSAYASKGHYNDMDMLEVGRGLNAEEDQTHFALWCIMDSPLLIGCDLTKLSAATLSLLKNTELIALNQDSLHLQAHVARYEGGCYLLVKDFARLQGTRRAVAVYNATDGATSFCLSFRDVCLGGKVHVRDLLARADVGVRSGTFTVKVPAHGTRVFMLAAARRLEQTRYEAETAYIGDYQELTNNQAARTGIYNSGLAQCSGQADAGWLGCSEQNDLQWRNVYSRHGGEYTLTIAYLADRDRHVSIDVNGRTVATLTLSPGTTAAPATAAVKVRLRKGVNVLRLHNASDWMPDIDYVDLVPSAR